MAATYKYIFNEGLGNELTLNNEPLNWEGLQLTLKRSSQYQGLFKSFTGDLEFWGDGADYIKSAKENNGLNTDTFVNIYVFNLDTYVFEILFEGKINFVNYDEKWSDEGLFTVITNLEESSFEQRLLTGDKVECDIYKLETRDGSTMQPFPDTEGVDVFVSGQTTSRFLDAATQSDFKGFFDQIIDVDINEGDHNGWIHWSLTDTNVDGSVFQNVFFYPTQISLENTPATLKYFFKAEEAGVYTLDWLLRYRLFMVIQVENDERVTALTLIGYVEVRSSEGLVVYASDLYSPTPTFPATTIDIIHEWVDSVTLNLDVGNEVYFYAKLDYSTDDIASGFKQVKFNTFEVEVFEHTMTVSGATLFRDTSLRGMFPWEASNRIVEFLTNKPLAVRSDILSRTDQDDFPATADGIASLMTIMGGKDTRGYPKEQVESSMTLANFMAAFSAMFNMGLGVEDNNGDPIARIEDISYFYDNTTQLLSITSGIKGLSKVLLSDQYYSSIVVGYDKYKIEDRNFQSSEEFITQRNYSTGVFVLDQEIRITSPFIAAGYGFEYMRRNQYSTVTDLNDGKRFDDDVFVLSTVRTADIEIPVVARRSGTLAGPDSQTVNTIMYQVLYVSPVLFPNDSIFRDQVLTEGINDIVWATAPKDQPRAWVNTAPTGANNTDKFLKMGGEIILHPQPKDYTFTGGWKFIVDGDQAGLAADVGTVTVLLRWFREGGAINDVVLKVWDPWIDGNIFDEVSGVLNGSMLTTDAPLHYQLIVDATDLDISTPFIGMRLNFNGNQFDHKFDVEVSYDTFALYQQERIQDYYNSGTTVDGLLNWESGMNYRVSPRQMMERHSKTLNQINDLTGQNVFRHQKSEGNVNVVINDPDFDEQGDVPSNTGSLWKNEKVNFSAPWDLAKHKVVNANRYGFLNLDLEQLQFNGFIDEIVWDVEQDTAEISLLEVYGPPTVAPVMIGVFTVGSGALRVNIEPYTDNQATNLECWRSTSSGGTYTLIQTTGIGTLNFIDTGLPASTTYFYKVRATNSVGETAFSAVGSETTLP